MVRKYCYPTDPDWDWRPSPNEQMILTLRQHFTNREIADHFGVTIACISARAKKARQKRDRFIYGRGL